MTTHRRTVLHAGFALAASALAPRARACEFFAPNLRVYRPWTRDTGDDDFAIVCVTFDQVTQADRLIGIDTPVAERAELAGRLSSRAVNLPIPADRTTVLDESGTHLRLVGLRHPLRFGRSYPMNFVFDRGGVVVGDVDVDYDRAS